MRVARGKVLTFTVTKEPRGLLTQISAYLCSPISGTTSGKNSAIHFTNRAGFVIRAKSAVGANKVHVNDLSY